MKDALTDDLFLIAYSYNSGIPRFYTKVGATDPKYEKDYDVKMDFAAAATSATPYYFDPVTRYAYNNKKRYEEVLIDGSILANNPSVYAFIYAKYYRELPKVRVISIGSKPKKQEFSDT